MAPKKNKSKLDVEEIPDLATGWRKSKMSEAAVQELENMKLPQSQAVMQWRAVEGEDVPYEGTLETVMFCDFVERGLVVPVSEFFHALLQFWGTQLHHLTPQSGIFLYSHICVKHSLASSLIFIFYSISSSLYQSLTLAKLPSSVDVS